MARNLVFLLVLTIGFPPVGIPLLLAYAFIVLTRRLSRGGGIVARRRADAWAARPPVW
jgi:hypothetical protein